MPMFHCGIFALAVVLGCGTSASNVTQLLNFSHLRDVYVDRDNFEFGLAKKVMREMDWTISWHIVDDQIPLTLIEGLVSSKLGHLIKWTLETGLKLPLVIFGSQAIHFKGFCPLINQKIFHDNGPNDTLEHRFCVQGSPKKHSFTIHDPVPSSLTLKTHLRGHSLKVLAEIQSPFVRFQKPRTNVFHAPSGTPMVALRGELVDGMLKDILNIVAQDLDLRFEWFARTDRNFGFPLANGTWVGIVANLIAEEDGFDMAVAPFTANLKRWDVIDFLHPLGSETRAILIKKKLTEDPDWSLLLSPFHFHLWLTLLTKSWLIVLLTIGITLLYQNYPRPNHRVILEQAVEHILNCIGSIFGKKMFDIPLERHIAVKLIIFFLFLEGNVIFMAYKASLTSELSFRKYTVPFDDLTSLWQSDYQLIMEEGGGLLLHDMETAPSDSLMKRLYEKNMNGGIGTFVPDFQSLLSRLLNGEKIAAFGALEEFQSIATCEIISAWHSQYPDWVSYIVPKNSPYKEILMDKLLKMREDGILTLLASKWIKSKQDCPEDPFSSLSLKKMIGMFGLLGIGFTLAITLFMLESVYR